jgi:hypothetical protein
MVPCRSECKAAWSMGSSPGRSVHACRDLVDPSASCPTDPRGECFFKISLGELGNCVADCSNHHDRDGHTCSLGHQPSSLNVPRGSIWLRQRYPFIWMNGSRSVTRPADRLVVKGGSVPASFVLKLGTAADAGDRWRTSRVCWSRGADCRQASLARGQVEFRQASIVFIRISNQ